MATATSLVVLAVTLLGSTGAAALPDGAHVNALPAVAVTCVNDPTQDTPALQAAIASAGKSDGEVDIAAGNCALNADLLVRAAVTIDGAGADATFLVQQAHKNIFQINGSGVTIENLNLDTATFNASLPVKSNPNPAVLFSNANNTTVSNVTAEAGSGFGMRFVGPNPCAQDSHGGDNISGVDVTTTGTGGFAAIDVSCQNGASLSDITINGGMIAIYRDQNVTVSGETFSPGPYAKSCAPPWFITGPADSIAIDGVTSAGGHGVVHLQATNLTITNQTITNPKCT